MKRGVLISAVAAIVIGAAVAMMPTDAPVVTSGATATTAEPKAVTLYKNPQCTCCEGYADYLRANGFKVAVKPTHNLSLMSREAGIPDNFQGCHLAHIDGYAVSGHVPVNVVNRLLAERPAIRGITLPGMPEGSPGMTGAKTKAFTIYELSKDPSNREARVYAVE